MPTHDEDIEDIREEIEKRENCRAVYSTTTVCKTASLGEPFAVQVETFELVGKPEVNIAYGWKMPQFRRSRPVEIWIFLRSKRVKSPETALEFGSRQILLKELEHMGL